MDNMEDKVNMYYTYVSRLVESLNSDSEKFSKGNKSAGLRLRKSLRHLKNVSSDFINVTLGKETKHELFEEGSED